MPITPRTLETLIRLSTAHAKARLCDLVEDVSHYYTSLTFKTDAEAAMELLYYALFAEVQKKKREKKIKTTVDKIDSDEDDAEDDQLSNAEENDVEEREETFEELVLANQLSALQTDEPPMTPANVAAAATLPVKSVRDETRRYEFLLERLNIVKSRIGLLGMDDQMMDVTILLAQVNDGVEKGSVFEEDELLERVKGIDTIYFHEEENQVIFL